MLNLKKSKFKNLKISFKFKFLLYITLLIFGISICFVTYFVAISSAALKEKQEERGLSMVKYLSYSSELGIAAEDESFLRGSFEGIYQENDVKYVIAYSLSGKKIKENIKTDVDAINMDVAMQYHLRSSLPEDVKRKIQTNRTTYQTEFVSKDGKTIYDFYAPVIQRSSEMGITEESEIFEEETPNVSKEGGQVIGFVRVGMSLEHIEAQKKKMMLSSGLITAIIFGIGIFSCFLLANRITKPIQRFAEGVRQIGKGKLDYRIEIRSGDEIGQLATDFNQMAEDLRMLAKQISDAGLEITTASSEILAASEQQASGATEQAASVTQTTVTIEEWATTSKQIAENANLVAQAAEQTLATAQSGQEAMARLSEEMNQIRTTSEQSAKRIIDLGEKSQQIGDVIQIIDKIADETHLLALNASIEAARAGEAGRGFAVVATEVRNLAQSVVESTKEIRDLITEIQNSISASVMATEEGTKRVEQGVELAQRTAESLGEIVGMIEQTMEAAKQISFSTQQQRSTSEQVVVAMQEISGVSTQSTTSAKQVTSSAGKLNQLASDLQKAIVIFKLQSEEAESEVSDSAPKEVSDGKT